MDMKQFRKHLTEANPKKNLKYRDEAREREITSQCARDMLATLDPFLRSVRDLSKEWQSLVHSSLDSRVFEVGTEKWPFRHDDVDFALKNLEEWVAETRKQLQNLQKK